MHTNPLLLHPTSPSELLLQIIDTCSHPTTLLICSTKADFLARLASDPALVNHDHQRGKHPLLLATLHQIAIARHIRTVFLATVTHLRAFLAGFSTPCAGAGATVARSESRQQQQPLLVAYGFLDLHAFTSEWSAQGLGNTAAQLVETAGRHGFRAVVVEPRTQTQSTVDGLLKRDVPILGTAVRMGLGAAAESPWASRTVEAGRVLGRWFRLGEAFV